MLVVPVAEDPGSRNVAPFDQAPSNDVRLTLAMSEDFPTAAPASVMKDLYGYAVGVSSFVSDRTKLAFCVSTTDLDSGRGDVFVAVGLGRHMRNHGYEVAYFPPESWEELPPDTDLAIAMLPTFNPTMAPDGCRAVAWVRNETERWLHHPQLGLFDAILTNSPISLSRIIERYDGPTGLLPLAADTDLFRAPGAFQERAGVVTTVNDWGRERHLYRSLGDVEISFRFTIFGNRRNLDARYLPYHAGTVSYFSLPAIYSRSLVVLDDLNHTTRPYGNVNSRLFESLACGALPLTNSALGLADLGLSGVPTYSDGPTLGSQLARLLANPEDAAKLARTLAAHVHARHSFVQRAATLHSELNKLERKPRRVARPLVGFFPNYHNNPYQKMLMSHLRREGIETMPVADVTTEIAPHRRTGQLDGYVLHIHWTDALFQSARTSADALEVVNRLESRISELRGRGAKLAWTIHNIFGHEPRFPVYERMVAMLLANHADVIHVMSSDTVMQAAPHYQIPPDKVRLIPHSSYTGYYPESVSRIVARDYFGLRSDEFVFLFFGLIRPYKGLELLIEAFNVAAERDARLRLIIAGKPHRLAGSLEDLTERCQANERITTAFEFIVDDEVQRYYKAADAVVLPYRSILNSGALQLALTFGRPVVAPSLPSLANYLDPAYSVQFIPDNVLSLRDALLAVMKLRGSRAEVEARRAALRYRPCDMAQDYASLIADVLGQP